MKRQFNACQTPRSMYLSIFNSFRVIRCLSQCVSPKIAILPHFCVSPICQAAGDFCFPAHHACARALSCYDTRLRTSHQTWPPNRSDLSSVDYRLRKPVRNCFCQKQQGMSNIVNELWLLTE